MQCMKCGRDMPAGQIFCDECLDVMEQYPVKPGTVVQLPNRTAPAPQRKNYSRRRAQLTPEEQVKKLKKRIWILSILLVLSLAACCALGYLTAQPYIHHDEELLPGQNYTSVEGSGGSEGK